jgi:DNA repair exonuclease SbcCD ATPase subunit
VTLDGTLNGKPFTISRSKATTKTGLIFQLNGEDLTTQSVKETQALIEELLGVSVDILSRTMFHGQHAVNELLEATDAKLKEELSLLVPLKLWQAAASIARAKARIAEKKVSELEGMIALREQDLHRLSLKIEKAERLLNEKQMNLSLLEAQHEKQKNLVSQEKKVVDFQELELRFEGIEADLAHLSKNSEHLKRERETILSPLRSELRSAQDLYDSIAKMVKQDERDEYACSLNVQLAMERVQEMQRKWSVDVQGETSGRISVPDLCPTCRQPMGDGHSHETLTLQMNNDIDESIARRNASQLKLDEVRKRLEERRADLQHQEEVLASVGHEFDAICLEWQSKIDELEESRERKKRERNSISEQMAAAARLSQVSGKIETLLTNINIEKAANQYARETLCSAEAEMNEVEQRLEEMKSELNTETKYGRILSELGDRFGQRGVQSFVLQNIVDVLQECSQTYLDDLSDGSQRIEFSLDPGDRISRKAYVTGADGVYKERPLATLSGGQWRRCSLALTFGFAELVARRGKFRPSMCVLDEPLTHLDRSGRSKVGEVIRKMLRPIDSEGLKGFGSLGMSTVLIILQDLAAEELEEAFDCIDEVIKENSASRVNIDGFHSQSM